MKKQFSIILFSAVIMVLVAITVFSSGNNQNSLTKSNINSQAQEQTLPNSQVSGSLTGIALEELAKHSSKDDCWVLYKGKVYDLTSWIPQHPGGESKIIPHCGNEGFESAFIKKHGDSKASLFVQVAKLMGDFQLKGDLQ